MPAIMYSNAAHLLIVSYPVLFCSISVFQYNMELNDLRIIICLRKSEVTVERISVCNVTEKLLEHGIHSLPCSYTIDIIDLLP